MKTRKTAISIPEDVFKAADKLAKRLDLSRSELYSKAVAAWVKEHRDDGITEAINAYIEKHGDDLSLDPAWQTAQTEVWKQEEW